MIEIKKRQRLLVTGASGFVGSHLVDHICSRFDRPMVRSALRRVKDISCSDEFCVVGDINSFTDWSAALEEVDIVIHLAARVHVMNEGAANPLNEYRNVNVAGTLHLANEAAKAGVKRFIYLSSIKVNGESTKPGESFSERSIPNPLDPYGISKLEAELGLEKISAATGMEYVIIRPPLIYGPGVKANFRKLMKLVAKGIPLPFGAIKNHRSMLALDNLTSFIEEATRNPKAANQVFLLSDGEDLSTTRLLKLLANGMEKKAFLIPVPTFILGLLLKIVGQQSIAERLLESLQINSNKARQLLNWLPPVAVEKAIASTAKIYLQETAKSN